MTATDAELIAQANWIAGRGVKITPHSAAPGKTGASRIGVLEGNTAWSGAAMGAGGDSDKAVAPGSAVSFNVPANTTVTHYGVWNGSTFLRGYPLDASITVNATGPAQVDIIPRIKVTG